MNFEQMIKEAAKTHMKYFREGRKNLIVEVSECGFVYFGGCGLNSEDIFAKDWIKKNNNN